MDIVEATKAVAEAARKFMRFHATYGAGQEQMDLGIAVAAYELILEKSA